MVYNWAWWFAASIRLRHHAGLDSDALVHPGHRSSPGYSDLRYPIIGRIVKTA
jgi:hypothetical protein